MQGRQGGSATDRAPTRPDAHLGHARHVLDRFHVIRWFAAGLTQVRRDIQRREPKGVKPAFDPEVFKARFALLRRGDTLTDTDRARLDERPRLKAGWHALQELHGLYTADDYDGALEALGRFCDLYETRAASTTTSTRSSHGPTRSSTGTTPAAPPTAESRAPTTCSKSCDAAPTDSPTQQLRSPRHPRHNDPNRCQQPSIEYAKGPQLHRDGIQNPVVKPSNRVTAPRTRGRAVSPTVATPATR